ncbi:MAG: hypothetical protein WC370_10170 [Dehalococcoidales bacterium]
MENNQYRTFRCQRCGFVWRQLVAEGQPLIKACPKCSSPEWNNPKSGVGKIKI